MNAVIVDRLEELPTFLGGHLTLSLSALAVGLAVSLPLGMVVSRRPRLAEWARGAAGVIQTVPSLALLALMVPLLGGSIGFVPAFIALTLYSILPILANTVVGLRSVDPVLIEAGRGLGMNERQLLWRVQLPLAAPVILSGIRTAAVLVVATATLATPVGETTLGNYIFVGLEMLDQVAIVFGCVFAVLLAVGLDQLIRLLESAVHKRSRLQATVALLGLLLVVLGGLYRPLSRLANSATPIVRVGNSTFTEQYVLSEVIRDQLEAAGITVEQQQGLGKMIQFEALRRNQIDCCVDYTGTIWALTMKRTEIKDRQVILTEVTDYLREQHGIVCLGPLGFDNGYALTMRTDKARWLGIRTLDDLALHAGQLTLAADLQFLGRPEWVHVRDVYGFQFKELKPMEASLMYAAVAGDSVDVIAAYVTDGRISAYGLQVLEDGRHAFLPYDAVLLVSPEGSRKTRLIEALAPLLGSIEPQAMREANRHIDLETQRPRQVAAHIRERSSYR